MYHTVRINGSKLTATNKQGKQLTWELTSETLVFATEVRTIEFGGTDDPDDYTDCLLSFETSSEIELFVPSYTSISELVDDLLARSWLSSYSEDHTTLHLCEESEIDSLRECADETR